MQKKYKCFLFDLDGTLLDTAPEFLISLNSLLKKNKMQLVSDSFVRIRVSDGVGRLVQDSFKIKEDHSEFENLRNKLFSIIFNLIKTFSNFKLTLLSCLIISDLINSLNLSVFIPKILK